MKRKSVALILALALVMMLAACSSPSADEGQAVVSQEPTSQQQPQSTSEQPETSENAQPVDGELVSEKDIVIGVTSMTLKEAVYQFVNRAMVEQAAKYGNVTVNWVACENDPAVQMSQAETYIQQGVDIIVIEPARSDACQNIIEAINEAGIPIINMNAQIRGILVEHRSDSNSYEVGVMQVEKFMELNGDAPAKVAIFGGSLGDETAETITQAVQDTCAKYPNLEVVLVQMHNNWDRQLAMNTMESLLVQHPDLKAAFCNNDTMAHGCLKAAENEGKDGDMYFFGADWDEDSAELILSGAKNFYVVNKGASEQGIDMVNMAVEIVNGKEVTYDELSDGVKIKYSPMVMVGPENIQEQVELKYPGLLN